MKSKQLQERVKAAISKLIADNSFLLENDAHELSVSSKLANYLQQLFPNVDCEYNRHIFDVKTLYGYKQIRPDILIHQRGTDVSNLLVIEMKKKDEPEKEDIEKLIAMTIKGGEYGYDYGLFHAFEKRNMIWVPLMRWFENCAEVT